ncbi:DUF4412 domain-containing protein [Methylacidimicrobium tartarophylax]|uniref:DUF4412 domain-containing protein n=1 Tax=Methylacidimicrobium tartarophylax TaxID=1041768 RepID=A0A5E6MPC7_9BACT|nr:DUF4412 domain-containing protein [Methylacidimicrobium tartarophylax]VVM07288.1 hypothetical protein MAMT_01657 [Methylacidimicrobium tartarophylax]
MDLRPPGASVQVRFAALLATLLFLFGTFRAWGEQAREPYTLGNQFSVIQTTQIDGGVTIVQHLYRDGDKLRLESQQGPETQIILLRKDQKRVYTILPASKLVLESSYRDTGSAANLGIPAEAGASWVLEGKETIRGHACAKYRMKGNQKSVYIWVEEAGKFPLRVALMDAKTVVDWDQYQAGPQPAALFEPPADYQKISMSLAEGPR